MDADNSGTVSFEEFYDWWKVNKDRKSKGRFSKLSMFKRKATKSEKLATDVNQGIFGRSLLELDSGAGSFTTHLLASIQERCANMSVSTLFVAMSDDSALSGVKIRCASAHLLRQHLKFTSHCCRRQVGD